MFKIERTYFDLFKIEKVYFFLSFLAVFSRKIDQGRSLSFLSKTKTPALIFIVLGLWGLVNNAGIFHSHGCVEWLKIETYKDTLRVNLIGLIEVTLSMLPLVRRAQGRIVNVSSILGRIAFFGGVYCCSKYGVEAFSDILR